MTKYTLEIDISNSDIQTYGDLWRAIDEAGHVFRDHRTHNDFIESDESGDVYDTEAAHIIGTWSITEDGDEEFNSLMPEPFGGAFSESIAALDSLTAITRHRDSGEAGL